MKTDRQEIKSFYKAFLSMYVVLVLQNVISLSVNLADNVMLGSYSETALSGVAAVNQVQFVFQQLVNAVGDGIVILGSQYWGRKQTEPMKRVASFAMRIALVISMLFFVAGAIFPTQIVGLFTTDAAIIEQGAVYLRIVKYTYLFFGITATLLATMRSVEIVKIAFYLSVSTLFVNCGINYRLIHGRFGFPELGVTGAAIGTLVARIIETLAVIVYIWKKDDRLRLRFSDYLHVDKELNRDYIKVSLPTFIVSGLWGANTAMQTAILGHMTSNAIAANSAASSLYLLTKSMAVGAAGSAGVMIGKAIGMADMEIVERYSKRLQKTFVVIGIVSAVILFFIRIPILSLYDLTEETRAMANTFLIILCVVIAFMSYQMPTNAGIIKGGGSPEFVMKMDLISIWCIVIPVSLFMAFVAEASPVVVVCCLNADQVFKCIPAYIKANHGHWAKKLTRN